MMILKIIKLIKAKVLYVFRELNLKFKSLLIHLKDLMNVKLLWLTKKLKKKK